MSFDKPTRNALANTVGECRRLLTEDIRHQLQATYGLQPDGTALPASSLGHLDERGHEIARALREWQEHLCSTEVGTDAEKKKAAFERLAHETAFTVLNRLAALRMCEERGHVIECVRRGMESDGFVLYERFSGGTLGTRGETYRIFLERMFDELALDLGALFDLRAPQSLVFPRERCLEDVLTQLNKPELAHLWKEDETIGWVYQYFNSKEEREKMREESAAPRNSRELAVRNQFFTPRYVVEFLVDNTLGRIWYEMRKGETALKDLCRYLVRRPTEIFLKQGEELPASEWETASQPRRNSPNCHPERSEGSASELLKQPVYIPHRPKKDPRDLKIIDPACGSGHFLLYCFDLLETIYEEACAEEKPVPSEATGKSLREDYPDVASLKRSLPELILHYNLHGIDIDLRACQIAALALWLRVQRAYQRLGLKGVDRPKITKTNIVCGEPMPGEKALLEQFVTRMEPKVIGQLVRVVFEKMKLAGEAGSLLKIEEEVASAVADAKQRWLTSTELEQGRLFAYEIIRPKQQELGFDVSGITDESFWEKAEERIYAALQAYAEEAQNGRGYQRRLFGEDAARGFAFVDLCRKRYDVALMNPPFGDASLPSKPYLDVIYGDTKGDVYKAFVECFQARLVPAGYLGIISSRTGFFLGQSEDWRTRVVLRLFRPIVLADLGMGVLDAMVEVAGYVLRSLSESEARDLTLTLVPVLERVALDPQERFSLPKWEAARDGLKRHQAVAELEQLESAGFIRRCPGEFVRYSSLWHLVKEVTVPPDPVYPPFMCVRALADADKETALAGAIRDPTDLRRFICNPTDFLALPGAPFSYWVSSRIRTLFNKLPALETSERIVRQGLATANDFRFVRLNWECPSADKRVRWFPFVKGGRYSLFYADVHLMVHWQDNGKELKAWADPLYGCSGWSRIIKSTEHYFRPGLTWPLRARAFSPQAMPQGCVFSVRGYAILAPPGELAALLAITASSAFDYLFKVLLGRFGFPEFVVGVLQKLPLPAITDDSALALSSQAHRAWAAKRELDTVDSTSNAFVLPIALTEGAGSLEHSALMRLGRVRRCEETCAAIQAEIDDLAFRIYAFDDADRSALITIRATESFAAARDEADDDEEDETATASASAVTADLLGYAVGATFGRWDIRFATGENPPPDLPEPFAPLPICPPGMLQNEQGLPLTQHNIERLEVSGEWNYPLEILWDGILVNDPDNPNDVVRRVRKVLEVIWKDRSEAIEQEACEIIGVKDLREYFRKPALFFGDHLKRYSKSRRQAPIYWPLSTASGSYALWIYYHRLNDETFYSALNKYVKPKIDKIEKELRRIESDLPKATGHEGSKLRDAFEDTKSFLDELREFRDELLRVAGLPYKPNLNDGVLITASPLWRLFRLPKWRKDLEACWKKLEAGDYDWAHLAYTIWPDRVREVCKHDRSIAIAHGLEEFCEVPVKPTKKKLSRKQKGEVEEPVLGDEG
jgi:hypothetical protein